MFLSNSLKISLESYSKKIREEKQLQDMKVYKNPLPDNYNPRT